MGIKKWREERDLAKSIKYVNDAMDASVQGKPAWAMASRIAAIGWVQAQDRVTEYVAAYDAAGSVEAASEQRAAASKAVDLVTDTVSEMPVERASQVLRLLALLSLEIAKGNRPDLRDYESIGTWLQREFVS